VALHVWQAQLLDIVDQVLYVYVRMPWMAGLAGTPAVNVSSSNLMSAMQHLRTVVASTAAALHVLPPPDQLSESEPRPQATEADPTSQYVTCVEALRALCDQSQYTYEEWMLWQRRLRCLVRDLRSSSLPGQMVTDPVSLPTSSDTMTWPYFVQPPQGHPFWPVTPWHQPSDETGTLECVMNNPFKPLFPPTVPLGRRALRHNRQQLHGHAWYMEVSHAQSHHMQAQMQIQLQALVARCLALLLTNSDLMKTNRDYQTLSVRMNLVGRWRYRSEAINQWLKRTQILPQLAWVRWAQPESWGPGTCGMYCVCRW
jgi:hypothetical protein